jgi:hypothetical protein
LGLLRRRGGQAAREGVGEESASLHWSILR